MVQKLSEQNINTDRISRQAAISLLMNHLDNDHLDGYVYLNELIALPPVQLERAWVGGVIIKIPKNEILWVQYLVDGKPKYAITSDKLRSVYYLCEVVGEKLIKTKYKSKDPTELEKFM